MNTFNNIVVTGFARSGTTLLYNMLRSSVRDYYFFPHECSILDTTGTKTDKITKHSHDLFKYDSIKTFIPGCKFIVCVRDPRSLITSQMRPGGPYKQGYNYIDSKALGRRHFGVIHFYHALKQIIEDEDVWICKYEDLVKDPDYIQKELQLRLGFKYKDKFSNFYKHRIPRRLTKQMHGIRPVDQNSINKWKKHKKRVIEQFSECIELFDMLEFFNYEENKDWFTEWKNKET